MLVPSKLTGVIRETNVKMRFEHNDHLTHLWRSLFPAVSIFHIGRKPRAQKGETMADHLLGFINTFFAAVTAIQPSG